MLQPDERLQRRGPRPERPHRRLLIEQHDREVMPRRRCRDTRPHDVGFWHLTDVPIGRGMSAIGVEAEGRRASEREFNRTAEAGRGP